MTRDTASCRPARRRRYSAEVKAQVMAECDAPGVSVAKVAMSHGINANIVHRWRQLARESGSAVPVFTGGFVPVRLAAAPVAAPTAPADIQIQLRRGSTAMVIMWPVSTWADLAAWTREVLK